MKNINPKIINLVQLSLLVAIIFLMAFTPIGYLRTPLFSITFIMIPVVIGSILLGPAAGAFLGGIFGITSALQYFAGDQTAILFVSINPILYVILCLVPRIFDGWICGYIFRWLKKVDKSKFQILSYTLTSLSAALINTVFFVGLMLLFYTESVTSWAAGQNVIMYLLTGVIGFNGVIEALVCMLLGAAISRGMYALINKKSS